MAATIRLAVQSAHETPPDGVDTLRLPSSDVLGTLDTPNRQFAAKCHAAGAPLATACAAGTVVLSPEGFGPRWHPPREKERFCAAGRMLFLSLYEATARQPTRKELYDRCHEMVDLAQAGLHADRIGNCNIFGFG